MTVRKAVVDGATLSIALGEQKIFPELFIDMMAVGEQTGKFGSTMQLIADVYERELDKQIKIVSTLIPPLVMIVIAGIVGLVYLPTYLPTYQPTYIPTYLPYLHM